MLTLTLVHSKSTKGTEVYVQEGDDPALPQLYIRKTHAAKLGTPSRLCVVIGTPAEFESGEAS